MRGKKSERIILQKMIRYCDEIEQILKKHHSNREEFENDKEFQFACGMCIIQIGELVAGLDENFVKNIQMSHGAKSKECVIFMHMTMI